MLRIKIYKLTILQIIGLFFIFSCEDNSSQTDQIPDSIIVNPGNVLLQPEQTIQLRTSIIDKENNKIEDAIVMWTSENDAVAIVDENGIVTGKSKGSTYIMATVDNIQGIAEVTVSTIKKRVLSEMFTSST